MEKLINLLNKSINNSLISCVLSGKKNKLGDIDKVKIRQIILSDSRVCQVTEYVGQKVIHKNLSHEDTRFYIRNKLLTEFKQAQIQNETLSASILVSSKGKFTIKEKAASMTLDTNALKHNRKKDYLLPEGKAVPFLVDLGVMSIDGSVNKSKYDKFRQINRFLEFVRDIVPSLKKDKKLTILDFGCGKSYLTFAMYYYLKELMGFDLQIIGLDLKEDVISHCNKLAQKYGYDDLHFLHGDVADYEGTDDIDMMVTLHACDTATDIALAKAVLWNADVILSVPCCQHEFNKTIHNDMLKPIFEHGILKERISALITDGVRSSLLEDVGYESQILEFIDMEHTPKNLLIRAVKKPSQTPAQNGCTCRSLLDELNVSSTFYNILAERGIIR